LGRLGDNLLIGRNLLKQQAATTLAPRQRKNQCLEAHFRKILPKNTKSAARRLRFFFP